MTKNKPKTKQVRKPVDRYVCGVKMWVSKDFAAIGSPISATYIHKNDIDRFIKFLIKAEKYLNQEKTK